MTIENASAISSLHSKNLNCFFLFKMKNEHILKLYTYELSKCK